MRTNRMTGGQIMARPVFVLRSAEKVGDVRKCPCGWCGNFSQKPAEGEAPIEGGGAVNPSLPHKAQLSGWRSKKLFSSRSPYQGLGAKPFIDGLVVASKIANAAWPDITGQRPTANLRAGGSPKRDGRARDVWPERKSDTKTSLDKENSSFLKRLHRHKPDNRKPRGKKPMPTPMPRTAARFNSRSQGPDRSRRLLMCCTPLGTNLHMWASRPRLVEAVPRCGTTARSRQVRLRQGE